MSFLRRSVPLKRVKSEINQLSLEGHPLSEDQFGLIHPRDILLSTATLIGFTITAFGIITTRVVTDPGILKLSGVLLFTTIMFVASVISTTVASLSRRPVVWMFAQLLYMVGWISLAILIAALLLNVAYGIDIFAPPNIRLEPRYFGVLVTAAVSTVLVVVGYQLSYRLGKEIRSRLASASDFKPQPKPPESLTDAHLSFLAKVIKIESMLRSNVPIPSRTMREITTDLVWQEKIPKQLSDAIYSVWKVRNAVVHGVNVPYDDLVAADDLADYVLTQLTKYFE